jgi:hypothetical protein
VLFVSDFSTGLFIGQLVMSNAPLCTPVTAAAVAVVAVVLLSIP